MMRLKVVSACAHDSFDVRRCLLRLFSRFVIEGAQSCEPVPGVAELAMGSIVKLDRLCGFGVNNHNAIGRLLEERAIADFRLPQSSLCSRALAHFIFQRLVGCFQLRCAFADFLL